MNLQDFVIAVLAIDMIEEQPKWQIIKELCLKQNSDFKQWQKEKDYGRFHSSHYDWWAFPIDRRSSCGDKYKVFRQDWAFLIKDEQFIAALRSNAILVCESWGYDLVLGQDIEVREDDQRWQDWPIRLHKLTDSLQYFDQGDLFFNAIKYGLRLIAEGNGFTYGHKNLKKLFFKNEEFVKRRERESLERKAQGKLAQEGGQKTEGLRKEAEEQKSRGAVESASQMSIENEQKNQGQ